MTGAARSDRAAHDVVVTGVGALSVAGDGYPALVEAFHAGRPMPQLGDVTVTEDGAVTPASRGEAEEVEALLRGARRRVVGRVPPFDDRVHCGKLRRRMNRLARLAVTAAGQGLAEAGLIDAAADPERTGVVMGTAWGSGADALAFLRSKAERGAALVNPALFPPSVANAAAAFVSLRFGLAGFGLTLNSHQACADLALQSAADAIALGRADRIVAGGVTEAIPFMAMVLRRVRILAPAGTRPAPFGVALGRGHVALGEGAGVLILESAGAAQARGAETRARIAGWASAGAPSPPHGFGVDGGRALAAAVLRALSMADIEPDAVGAVVAGAAGLREQDEVIAAGLERAFGSKRAVPPVCAPAAVTGFFYAAGVLNALCAIAVLEGRRVPVTPGVNELSRRALLSLPTEPHPLVPSARHVLSVQCAEGGSTAAIVFSRD